MGASKSRSKWLAAGLAMSAIAAAALSTGALSKPTTPNGAFKGKTSNGLPVSFKVRDGKIRNFDATVHALCISIVSPGTSHLDPIFHHITPPAMKLAGNGRFSAAYKGPSSTRASVDGKVSGGSASGHYRISYTKTGGFTSLGTLIIYACQERGTWKASKR